MHLVSGFIATCYYFSINSLFSTAFFHGNINIINTPLHIMDNSPSTMSSSFFNLSQDCFFSLLCCNTYYYQATAKHPHNPLNDLWPLSCPPDHLYMYCSLLSFSCHPFHSELLLIRMQGFWWRDCYFLCHCTSSSTTRSWTSWCFVTRQEFW